METTFYKARLPGGLRMLYNRSCDVPTELRSGGRAAVTHTSHDAAGARGVWYYHAAGCSDNLLELGRTLLAFNGVDAALQLTQSAQGPGSTAADAARAIVAARPDYLGRKAEQARRSLGGRTNVSAAWLVQRAAALQQCPYRQRDPKLVWADRDGAIATSVASGDWWQDLVEPLLLAQGYDTLTLLQAPWMKSERGNAGLWGTEIWDVRSLRRLPRLARKRDKYHDSAPGVDALHHAPREVLRYLSVAGADASRACEPARHFERCLACRGSLLAQTCGAPPERCRATAVAENTGAARKTAVTRCVGPSLK